MIKFGYYLVKTFSLILTIFLLVVCLFFGFLYYCHTKDMPIPAIGPFKVYVVLTPSMEPRLKVNDAVIVVATDPNELRSGDIITFTAFETNAIITHRIVDKKLTDKGYVFTTKGDNNQSVDTFETPQNRIIGKYLMKVPQLATFLDYTAQRPYMIAVLVVIILLIQFICGFAERKWQPVKAEEVPAVTTPAPVATEQPVIAQAPVIAEQPVIAPAPVIMEQPVIVQAPVMETRQLQGLMIESLEKDKGSASDETNEE